LKAWSKKIHFLRCLKLRNYFKDQLTNVLDAMEERQVTAGEIVIQQGDDGDNFYVIDR